MKALQNLSIFKSNLLIFLLIFVLVTVASVMAKGQSQSPSALQFEPEKSLPIQLASKDQQLFKHIRSMDTPPVDMLSDWTPKQHATLGGELVVKSFTLPQGTNVEVTEDLFIYSYGDVVIDGNMLAKNMNTAQENGVNIMIRSEKSIVIQGLLQAGDGTPGSALAVPGELQIAGGLGGNGGNVAKMKYAFQEKGDGAAGSTGANTNGADGSNGANGGTCADGQDGGQGADVIGGDGGNAFGGEGGDGGDGADGSTAGAGGSSGTGGTAAAGGGGLGGQGGDGGPLGPDGTDGTAGTSGTTDDGNAGTAGQPGLYCPKPTVIETGGDIAGGGIVNQWDLVDVNTGVIIAQDVPVPAIEIASHLYYLRPTGCYEFTIYDRQGDGFARGGHYSITFNDEVMTSNFMPNGRDPLFMETMRFGTCGGRKQTEPTMGASAISIAPNPTNDVSIVRFQKVLEGTTQITLRDLQGRVVANDQTTSQTQYQVDLSQFPKGVYMITLKNEEWVQTGKIVKN